MRKRDLEYLGSVGYLNHLWRNRKDRHVYYVLPKTPEDKFTGRYMTRSFALPRNGKLVHVSKLYSGYTFEMNSTTIRIGCQRFNRQHVEALIRAHRLPIVVERRRTGPEQAI